MSSKWDGSLHYDDPAFISASIKMPLQIFKHRNYEFSIKYRQMGNKDLEEAVVFIPSTYETEASGYKLAELFAKDGKRFISLTTYTHKNFEILIQTLDQFFTHIKVKRVHLIGVDFGGFIALQIQNTTNFSAKIISLALINAFTRNDMFVPRSFTAFSVFGRMVAKKDMDDEMLTAGMLNFPTEGTKFVQKEISSLEMTEAGARLELRMAMTPPLYIRVPQAAIMSIEPLDRRNRMTSAFLPSLTLAGVKQALMKDGGDFPHLDAPEDLYTYVLCHINKWNAAETKDGDEAKAE